MKKHIILLPIMITVLLLTVTKSFANQGNADEAFAKNQEKELPAISQLDGIINGPLLIKQTDIDLIYSFEPSDSSNSGAHLIWSSDHPHIAFEPLSSNTARLVFLPGFNIPSGQNIINIEITVATSSSGGLESTSTFVAVRR